MVEPQPSKLMMRVRSPSPAPLQGPVEVQKGLGRKSLAERALGSGLVVGGVPIVNVTTECRGMKMEELGCTLHQVKAGLDRYRSRFDKDNWAVCRDSAHVAQVVEHSLGKGEVTGSIPVMGTKFECC